MKQFFINCFRVLLLYHEAWGFTNFIVKRFEMCSKDNSTTKFYGNISTENGKQYLDFDITLARPLDETVGCICAVESSLDGKTFIPLVTLREKDICKAANAHLGEFWYDIVRAAQATPKACPLLARRYYVHHYLLNFNTITLQAFPFGKLRSRIHLIDNNSKTKDILLCILTEVENLPF